MTMYQALIGGQDSGLRFEETTHAWDYLREKIALYLERLEHHDHLQHHHGTWDMFHDDMQARALAPYDLVAYVDGPDGTTWGVIRE